MYVFLLVWFALLAAIGLMSMVSVIQMLRYGIASVGTYLTTTLFLIIAFLVVFGTSAYLVTVDWQQNLDLQNGLNSVNILNI